jgi:glycosyltransferase involved in cell wall biosynthesis
MRIENISHPKVRLSIVVPISRMQGRLGNLQSWLFELPKREIEVWLIHDVQDDNTGTELAQLVKQLNNEMVNVIEGKFGCPGLARNEGLARSTGEWIAFWDSDDLPIVSALMLATNDGLSEDEVLIGGYKKVYSRGTKASSKERFVGNIDEVAFEPSLWRMAFRRTSLTDIRFREFRMGEDQVFLSQFKLATRRLHFFPIVFYTYFTNIEGQLTGNKFAILDLGKAIQVLMSDLKQLEGQDFKFTAHLVSNQLLSTVNRGTSKWKRQIYQNVQSEFLQLPMSLKIKFVIYFSDALRLRLVGIING